MKVPHGWWRVDAGHYRLTLFGLEIRYRLRIPGKVSENDYRGWYVEATGEDLRLGPFKTATLAFAAIGCDATTPTPPSTVGRDK